MLFVVVFVPMFIRKSPIKSKKSGGAYFSYRLVESVRVDGKVQQKTILNLGKHFDIDPAHWSWLAQRIDQIIHGENPLDDLFNAEIDVDVDLEASAQRYAALALQKLSAPVITEPIESEADKTDYQSVDVNQLEVLQPRSIGGETLALHAFQQLQLDKALEEMGFNKVDRSAALGNIIGRIIHPGSERETHRWLQQNSALGELVNYDFGQLSLDRLYKVGDKLLNKKVALETHLAAREQDLFNLTRHIILYDLTNTYFEGQASSNPKARRGRSKEKRSDCPLVTMGLVLDGDGFPLGSQVFEGNASEPATLEIMLNQLGETSDYKSSTVVLDAGIATQANLDWLKNQGFHYIVVSRERYKEKPDLEQGAVIVKDIEHDRVMAKRVVDTETQEVRLYCHSEKREVKESAIRSQFAQRFETALQTLHEGLTKKGTTKRYNKVIERIGRMKEKYSRVAQDYVIDVKAGDDKLNAIAIEWSRNDAADKKDNNAGVYCLRTDIETLSEQELWKTYIMLTEVESSFKSMKSELGMRPVYHQKEERVTAHLFITLLAYHLVHTLRVQFKAKGIHLSWDSIRNLMDSQQRITVSMPTKEGQQIHVRTTSRAEPAHQQLYDALGVESDAIGNNKAVID